MNINQKYIDLHLLSLAGYGNVDYTYDDCKLIQEVIQKGFGVTLSIRECYDFWHWRSEQYEASFLNINGSTGYISDIQEWFISWLKETDYAYSCELFEEAAKPTIEKPIEQRAEELKDYAKSLSPEQMRELTERFKTLIPPRISYADIAKKLFPVEPMPEGAMPFYMDHLSLKKEDGE